MSDAYTERLLDLAYGELPGREAREVEAHAAACDACRAELARIRGTRRAMAALPHEPAPERGERILLAAARQAAEARRPRRLVPRWLLGGAVAAASLAIVTAVSIRVAEMAPRRDPRDELADASRYAAAPPAEAEQGAPAPVAVEPPAATAPPASASAPAASPPAPASRSPVRASEPQRVAAAPAAPRRSAPAAAPPPSGAPGPYASPPPPAAAADEASPEAGFLAHGDDARQKAEAPAAVMAAPAPPAPAAPRAAIAPAPSRASGGGAMRKSAAAPEAEPRSPSGGTAAERGASPVEVRTFRGCEGESTRRVELDAAGRVVRYVREGRIDGRRLRIVHAFGPDGRPAGVAVTDLDAPGAALDPRALGLSLPAHADEARIDAPPRCGR